MLYNHYCCYLYQSIRHLRKRTINWSIHTLNEMISFLLHFMLFKNSQSLGLSYVSLGPNKHLRSWSRKKSSVRFETKNQASSGNDTKMERNHSASSWVDIFRQRLISNFADWLNLPNYSRIWNNGGKPIKLDWLRPVDQPSPILLQSHFNRILFKIWLPIILPCFSIF